MKLAAIDIGSNAARLQITNVLTDEGEVKFKKVQYLRFPLRLGEEVFSSGHISDLKKGQFLKLMKSFKLLMDLYQVDHYYACATSAMRDADNGKAIADFLFEQCDIKINIISGQEEAELINRVISYHLSDDYDCLHVDVGGGSTELNLYQDKVIVASKSFSIGSVRLLKQEPDEFFWDEMKEWIKFNIAENPREILAIGTGGNIGKLFNLAKGTSGKHLSYKKLNEVRSLLMSLTLEERINKLMLNEDRADVIIPASQIYLFAMQEAKATKILVPDVGLKDGILTYLYESI